MSVDKFGHYSGRGVSGSGAFGAEKRGPPGIGFTLTADGDYDIQNKRLCRLADPAADQDAITLKRANQLFLAASPTKKRKITQVEEPSSHNDAVSLKFVKDNCLVKEYNPTTRTDTYNAQNHKITNVLPGEANTDVMTVGQLVKTGLSMIGSIFKDAVDYQAEQHNGHQRNADGDNLSEELKSSIRTLVEVQKKTFTQKKDPGPAGPRGPAGAPGKQGVRGPTGPRGEGFLRTGDAYDMQNKRIINVGKAVGEDDAANQRLVKQLVKDILSKWRENLLNLDTDEEFKASFRQNVVNEFLMPMILDELKAKGKV